MFQPVRGRDPADGPLQILRVNVRRQLLHANLTVSLRLLHSLLYLLTNAVVNPLRTRTLRSALALVLVHL